MFKGNCGWTSWKEPTVTNWDWIEELDILLSTIWVKLKKACTLCGQGGVTEKGIFMLSFQYNG